jgi:membrane protease YdiL (CAAX protease family)
MSKYIKTILIILYYFIFNVVIYVPFSVLDVNVSSIPDALYNTYFVSVQIIFIASLLYIYRDDFKHYWNDFKKNGKSYIKLGFNYWIFGLSIMIVSNIIIGSFSPISIPENEQAVRDAMEISPLFIMFASVIEAPLIEEILFRKLLFDIIKNKNLFIIVSGLLFGAFHIIGIGTSVYSWLYIIPYGALGIAFAYALVKTNNLLTTISMHAFHNFITILQILLLWWSTL